MSLQKAIAEELTKSYLQAGRHISSDNVKVVANSLMESIDFDSEEEVRATFKRARDMEDIPTQRVLKESLRNHRAETIPAPKAVTNGTTEDTRPVTNEEKDYVYAWWHLHGTKNAWMTDGQAQDIVSRFESDPTHKEFATYQNTKWTPVAYRNMKLYGIVTMKTRFV